MDTSEPLIGDDSFTLSTSWIVEIDGAAATGIGSDLEPINCDIDFRPTIGSNLSSIESRGLIWFELHPLDSRKSKSFGFKITGKNKTLGLIWALNFKTMIFIRIKVKRKLQANI